VDPPLPSAAERMYPPVGAMYPPRLPMYPDAPPLLAAREGAGPPWPDGREPSAEGDRRPGGGANCCPGATGCLGGDHCGGGVMRPRAAGAGEGAASDLPPPDGGVGRPPRCAFAFGSVFEFERAVDCPRSGPPGKALEGSAEGSACSAAIRASAASIRACSSGSMSQLLSESVSVSAGPPPRPRPRPPHPLPVSPQAMWD
jgi:hypothetical protein